MSGSPARPRGRRKQGTPVVEIVMESPRWASLDGLNALLRQALAEAAAAVRAPDGEVAIVLTDDTKVRELNFAWRGKDEPTNVLSFPAPPLPESFSVPGHARMKRKETATPRLLGDIVIAYETTAREAEAETKPLRDHLAHLAVHGFLHLLGYDHETEQEADAMERIEIAALARLKVPNPYVARDAKG
jgi:probable rRNA maturation factor